jgi:Leucine-rich repeat (LRR) protein
VKKLILFFGINQGREVTMSRLEFIDDEARARFYSGEVRELVCRGLSLAEIPELPEGLEILDASSNSELKRLPKLPKGLRELYTRHCELKELPKLPNSLQALGLKGPHLLWGARLPKELRALSVSDGNLECLGPLNELRMLVCVNIKFRDFYVPRNLRMLSLNPKCNVGDEVVLNWFPPELEFLDISCEGIFRLANLPSTLKYLKIGKSLQSMPNLPEGLEALNCFENWHLRELPNLPNSLKILDVGSSKIRRLPKLPDGLRRLYCQKSELTSLPSLPDALELINLSCTQICGELVVPSRVKYLVFNNTQVERVQWRGGIMPPLIHIVAYSSRLNTVPPLPENIEYIDVSNCRLEGVWRGYFAKLDTLKCQTNDLTELPSIGYVQTLMCRPNQLTHMPDVVAAPRVGGLPDNKTPAVKWFPSLRELCGAVVYPQWLNQRVGIAELDEYLATFCRCPGCEKMAHVEKKFFCDDSEFRVAAWMCYKCEPGNRPRTTEPFSTKLARDYSDEYFNQAVAPYLMHDNNTQQWFTISPATE